MESLMRALLVLLFFSSAIAIIAMAIWLAIKVPRRIEGWYERRRAALYVPPERKKLQENGKNYEENLFIIPDTEKH